MITALISMKKVKVAGIFLSLALLLILTAPSSTNAQTSYLPSTLTSQPNGSSVQYDTPTTFTWEALPYAEQYWIGIGTTYESISTSPWGNIYAKTTGLNTSYGIDFSQEFPQGAVDTVHVRIWTLIEGVWEYNDYEFEVEDSKKVDYDLTLESSIADPHASVLGVSEDNDLEYGIFAFDLSAKNSDDTVYLDELSIDITVGGTDGTSLREVVEDLRLEIDGVSFEVDRYKGTGQSESVSFEIDDTVILNVGDTVTAMLYTEFASVSESFSEATIKASITATQINAWGEEQDMSIGGETQSSNTYKLQIVDIAI